MNHHKRTTVATLLVLFGFILCPAHGQEIAKPKEAKTVALDKKIKSFKEKSKFSSWLFQIGYRKALDFLAKKKRQRTALDKMEAKSPMADNEREFEIKQADSAIARIIDDLQQNHRTALHLFYREEMTYNEIASVMKVPINTVKSYIYRGKEIIREKLSRMDRLNKQPT